GAVRAPYPGPVGIPQRACGSLQRSGDGPATTLRYPRPAILLRHTPSDPVGSGVSDSVGRVSTAGLTGTALGSGGLSRGCQILAGPGDGRGRGRGAALGARPGALS